MPLLRTALVVVILVVLVLAVVLILVLAVVLVILLVVVLIVVLVILSAVLAILRIAVIILIVVIHGSYLLLLTSYRSSMAKSHKKYAQIALVLWYYFSIALLGNKYYNVLASR